jgi:hypothetical protein
LGTVKKFKDGAGVSLGVWGLAIDRVGVAVEECAGVPFRGGVVDVEDGDGAGAEGCSRLVSRRQMRGQRKLGGGGKHIFRFRAAWMPHAVEGVQRAVLAHGHHAIYNARRETAEC